MDKMATEVNQRGYDVVSSDGQRISVKTTTKTDVRQIPFTSSTLEFVDRIIVLRINTEEMQVETIYDAPIGEARPKMEADNNGKLWLPLNRTERKTRGRGDLKSVKEVIHLGRTIRELENGTIEVEKDGTCIIPVKPTLRELAQELNVGLLNGNGNIYNTRQLGSQVIKSILELQTVDAQQVKKRS